jgi:hypothetical protein
MVKATLSQSALETAKLAILVGTAFGFEKLPTFALNLSNP